MKKSFVRVLLSVCVAAMLLGCLGIPAFADFNYTVKSGDTVYGICKRYGIDFAKNEAWIKQKNNITNYKALKVGQVLTLPGNGNGNNTTATTTTTTATNLASFTTLGTVAATNVSGIKTGDIVVCYLINHKLQAGETVGGVCAKYGVDFESNSGTIKALSGITNWNSIPVGKVIVIPSLVAPAAGSTFTAIVGHKVVGGETVAGICSSYGVDYGKNIEQLKALNNTTNLNVIRVGQYFYLPVAGTAVNPTPTPTPTPSSVTSDLKVNSSGHGTFILTVNGVQVQNATAGQTVTIVTKPATGFHVSAVSVVQTTTGTVVPVTNNTFVMPSAPVRVTVDFAANT
jgi:LysM repeat protein